MVSGNRVSLLFFWCPVVNRGSVPAATVMVSSDITDYTAGLLG